jgi:hypothetical protein
VSSVLTTKMMAPQGMRQWVQSSFSVIPVFNLWDGVTCNIRAVYTAQKNPRSDKITNRLGQKRPCKRHT